MPSHQSLTLAILGAGASVVQAFPRPQFFGSSPPQYPTFSFPGGFAYPTGTPTGFSTAVPTSSLSYPVVPASSGVGAISTGYSASASDCTVSYVYGGTGSGSSGYSIRSTGVGGSSSAGVATSSYVESNAASSAPVSTFSTFSSAMPSNVASSDIVSSTSLPIGSSAAAISAPASSESAPPSASSSAAASTAPSTVTASSGCTFTDADTAAASKGSCSAIVLSDITVPAGETLDMTDLNDGTTVTFEGTTTFEYAEWEGPLISFSGKSITITGASGHVIDGNGAKWWDGLGSNGGVTKPKFFYAHDLTDSIIKGLNVKNTPVQGFSVDGASNLNIEDVTIDDSDGDTEGGHNTDCFDIGESTGVYLSGITCKNQDDCIAINSGSDIQFTGGTCSGGHGLSIGSVGGRDDNTVENVYIGSSSISDSENGVRIKCNSGDTGSVNNVTYEHITLSGITDFGIVIEQDYENGSPTGTPTAGIPITDLTLTDITGSVADDAQAYYILCAACSDWTVSGVDVTGGSVEESCEGVPSGVDLC